MGDVVLGHVLEQPLDGRRGVGWGHLAIGSGAVARRVVQGPHVDVGIYGLALGTVLHHILLPPSRAAYHPGRTAARWSAPTGYELG